MEFLIGFFAEMMAFLVAVKESLKQMPSNSEASNSSTTTTRRRQRVALIVIIVILACMIACALLGEYGAGV